MASYFLESVSDTDLSDIPYSFDGLDIDDVVGNMALSNPPKRKTVSRSVISDSGDEAMADVSDMEEYHSLKKPRLPHIYSKFEEVPIEVRPDSLPRTHCLTPPDPRCNCGPSSGRS